MAAYKPAIAIAMPENKHTMHTIKTIITTMLVALAATATAQTTQNIRGMVYDEASHAALSGAIIILVDTSGAT